MSNVLAFRDPRAPIEGEPRLKALQALEQAAPALATEVLAQAFFMCAAIPGTKGLACEDILPAFCGAIRAELDKVWPEEES